MKYRRSEAKDYARSRMKGIWAAALMPFAEDRSVDEAGFRRNLRHWVDDLGIDYWDRRNGLIDSVTLEDVKRVANRLLNGGVLFTVVGRTQTAAAKQGG